MILRELPLDGPLDLMGTLGPLVRGHGDRTIRLASREAWWTTRTADGPATLHLVAAAGTLVAEAWGAGADLALERAGRLVGVESGRLPTETLASVEHRGIAGLARRRPGIRTLRTEAVFDALVAAILEQKVTGSEAHRAWHGLVRRYGEPAPGPAGSDLGLRLLPAPTTLATLPYYAYHPFGVERRRAELIRAVAARAAWFEAIVHLPLPDAYARLLAVPGVGPWTAAEVAVRALGDDDAVSVGDFHIPNLVAWALAGEPRGDDSRMLELLEPYRGRRALVVRLLELSGLGAPRYGPRLAPRRIEAI
jgi:3-methyladenine DNA glycosylase/8-oxoguanine DNA glycosylase